MSNLPPSKTQTALVVKRIFGAPIERVFEAWTNAGVLASWFGPTGFTVKVAELDLKIGGKYLIVLQSPAGETIRHFGEYVEITPPKKLSFTWILQNQACSGSENQCTETLVNIDFKWVNQFTEVTLTHERLASKEAYDGHAFGWNSSFDCLEQFVLIRNG